jgi:maltooligosyltrehalose trehalohydrolase
MGQEYDEASPFQFFTSFDDPAIQKAVSEGRLREFAEFGWTEVPDPQDPATFERSRLPWPQAKPNLDMLTWYRALLQLRREYILPGPRTAHAEWIAPKLLTVEVPAQTPCLRIAASLPGATLPGPSKDWSLKLDCNQDGYHTQIYTRSP